MYKHFYGFTKDPFNLTPDPDFLYLTPSYREALAQLIYGVRGKKGLILLTGEVGVGKTTILKSFLNYLKHTGGLSAFIFNSILEPIEFFHLVCEGLGLSRPNNKADFLISLNKFLTQCLEEQKAVAIVVDEAHNLSPLLLEEIRLLLNLETNNQKLLQIVLCGQPELWEKLNTPKLRQLRQRIALRFILNPLNRKETENYIKTRLIKAGGKSNIFNTQAIDRIYTYSKGIPRIINIICDHALIEGYATDKKIIGADIIEQVVKDMAIRDLL